MAVKPEVGEIMAILVEARRSGSRPKGARLGKKMGFYRVKNKLKRSFFSLSKNRDAAEKSSIDCECCPNLSRDSLISQ